MTLDMLKIGDEAYITAVEFCEKDKKRLCDIGISECGQVKCAFMSPFGWPRAYDFDGVLIALRKEEAEKIVCERCER